MTDGFRMRFKKDKDPLAAQKLVASKELRNITKKYVRHCALPSERIVACVVGSDGFDWANAMSYMGSRVCYVSRLLRKGGMLGVNHVLFQRLLDTEIPLRVIIDDDRNAVFYDYNGMRLLLDESTAGVGGVVWFKIGLGVRVLPRSEREIL
jgi:hypothetical protein